MGFTNQFAAHVAAAQDFPVPLGSEPGSSGWHPQTNVWNTVAVTDYAASTGVAAYATTVNTTGGVLPGIMQKNTTVRISDVTDGLSNTFLIVESAGRPQDLPRWCPVRHVPTNKVNGGGWARPASDYVFQTSTPDGLNYPGTCPANCTNGFDYPTYNMSPFGTEGTSEAYSFHTGVVNTLLGDSSVHSISRDFRCHLRGSSHSVRR